MNSYNSSKKLVKDPQNYQNHPKKKKSRGKQHILAGTFGKWFLRSFLPNFFKEELLDMHFR